MIEFIVEDGTGLNNATSYIDTAYFIQYWENRGVNYTLKPVDTIKAWLNEATQFIDLNYLFCGYKVSDDQSLQLPKSDLTYKDGSKADLIPREILIATAEIAKARKANSNLNTFENGVKSKSIAPVSVTYTNDRRSKDIKKQYTAANQALNKLCQKLFNYVDRY